jgi:hypothetical protein
MLEGDGFEFEPSVPRVTDNAFRDPCSTIPEITLPQQRTGSFARGTDGSNPAFWRVCRRLMDGVAELATAYLTARGPV